MKFKGILAISFLLLILSGCSTKDVNPQKNTDLQKHIDLQKQDYYNAELKCEETELIIKCDFDHNQTRYESHNLNLSKYLDKKLGYDCSGFVSLVNKHNKYMYFDESMISKFYDKNGRKSQAIFNLYKSQNKISYTDPKPGDLVFFNNTTSKTNKSKNKFITHLGIVDKVAPSGVITFMHNIKGKNIKSVMNLKHKNTYKLNGEKINAYIISKCGSPTCLASNKFAGFGKIDKFINID